MLRMVALLAAALALSVTARAGSLDSPWNGNQCAGPFDPLDAIADSNQFLGWQKCVDLCKTTAKDCAKYVRGAFSCTQQFIADDLDVDKKECEDFIDAKACKASSEGNAAERKATNRANRDAALTQCKEWGDQCLSFCTAG
jgi:hypothetical protein